MNRTDLLNRLKENPFFDVIVIGGGASGLGAALDAASRGYKTALFEKDDFAKGTSSKSSKLIHGGIRYLRQGKLSFVLESLQERALLLKNAPQIVHPLPFFIPTTNIFSSLYYLFGLKLYDLLAGKNSLGASRLLKKMPEGVLAKTGVLYYDGQFDDAKLAMALAMTFVAQGGIALNYCPVTSLLKENGQVVGVVAGGMEIRGKAVINATGAFADTIRLLDDPTSAPTLTPSHGTHIVIDRLFFPSDQALVIPETSDKRVLFIIPWEGRVLVGTTDIAAKEILSEPKPSKEEIDYLLEYTAKYLLKAPTRKDILSVFTGIRPLIKPRGNILSTASLSREHEILISKSKLITIIGGKWTTYRKMGEEIINTAAKIGGLPNIPSKTKTLPLLRQEEVMNEPPLHPKLPIRAIDVINAVRHEMALQVEDVLSRRTRCLLYDALASLEVAPQVAALMAKELGKDGIWEKSQVESYSKLVSNYLPGV